MTNIESDGDIDHWWIYKVHGFKHDVNIYDKDGNYINGREPTRARIDKYWDEKNIFQKDNPIPVELVNYCSGDCVMYILAVPSSVIDCRRGYPREFNPADLKVTSAERDKLLQFCSQYDIKIPSDPKWFLSSLWM